MSAPGLDFEAGRETGWRIWHVVQSSASSEWCAQACYVDPRDMFSPSVPQPDYYAQACGDTKRQAVVNVLSECAADKDWPTVIEDADGYLEASHPVPGCRG